MASAAQHADPAAAVVLPDDTESASRAELDARNIRLLQEQLAQAKDALARRDELSEKQSEAFMEVARASDNRARDLEAQYAAKLAKLEFTHDAAMTAKDAAIADMTRRFADLKASQLPPT
jgi:polyhydroxyalkanoate synthesis regulator phasin